MKFSGCAPDPLRSPSREDRDLRLAESCFLFRFRIALLWQRVFGEIL